jgi:hypothetical protein
MAGVTSLAFVAGGRLHVLDGAGAPRALDSTFAGTVRDRAQEIHRRHSWKGEGSQGGFGALAWGRQPTGPPTVNARLTGLSRAPEPGLLLYSLEVDRLTAVCASDPASGNERRLLHGSKARLRDVCARPDRDEVACALQHPDGTASIALMSREASDLRQVTEGDSLDVCPTWADDGTPRIVYQSAGLGRDASGRPAGFGRFEVHALDLQKGEVETLAADADADLERPRIGPDGALYYLSRPHAGARTSAIGIAKDFLLLPVRLLFAVFQYLNFFSARYTGKPLTTAGGPQRKAGDLRRMLEWANLVDAQQSGADAEGDTGGVPRSHRLVRRGAGSAPEVVASGVACFDIASDGTLVYATGSEIRRLASDGRTETVCKAVAVESIVAL